MNLCVLLVALVLALLLAFLVSGEFAFVCSNRLSVELDKSNGVQNKLLSFFYKKQGSLLSALFFAHGILFFGYVYCSVSFLMFLAESQPAYMVFLAALAFLLFLLLVIDCGFRLSSRVNPTTLLRCLSAPIFLVYVLSYLVKRLFLFFGRVFGLVDKPVLSITRANVEEEAEVLLSGVQDSNGSEVDEVRLFRNALEFSNVLLKDCIVPRTELEAIDVNAGIEALRQLFVESNCSRILVYKENLDNMIGYVHSSDMFDQPEDIQSLLNPLIVVPEFMAANKLLKIFLQRKKSLALVVDEFGGTSGIVTLEDMMEEIFGEIEDEHDEDEYVAKSLNKDEYILSGRLEIEQVNEDFGLSLPVSDDYQTIAGLILAYNEILPQKGEVVELHPNFSFTIIRLVATRIDLVRLKVLDQEG